MTKIPIEAGTACLISNLPIGSVPKLFDVDGFIKLIYSKDHAVTHLAKRDTQAGSSFKQGIVVKSLPPTS